MSIAKTPAPPYFAVIFSSTQSQNIEGYSEMAERMESLAKLQAGYLGIESARECVGITVSYWKDLDSIKQWKNNLEHLDAQAMGQSRWYSHYKVRIARVDRDYSFDE